MISPKFFSLLVCILVSVQTLSAQEIPPAEDETSEPKSTSPFDFSVGVRIWGADLGIVYNDLSLFPNLTTTLRANIGGGYETYAYWRDAAGNLLASPDASQVINGPYSNLNFQWTFGIEQGILPGGTDDLLRGFVYYLGRTEDRIADGALSQLVFASGASDANGGFFNGLLAGLHLDAKTFKPVSDVESGYWVEASIEWGPAALSGAGTDYIRLNANGMGFWPLFEITEEKMNLFSAYIANFTSLDYAFGDDIPLFVKGTLGGTATAYRSGFGDAVRGIDKCRYNTNLKFVDNLELRLNGPSIFLPNLFPILVSFFDVGYFAQVGENVASPISGWRYSLGAELRVNVLDMVYPGLGYMYCLNDTINGNKGTFYVCFSLKFK